MRIYVTLIRDMHMNNASYQPEDGPKGVEVESSEVQAVIDTFLATEPNGRIEIASPTSTNL